MNIKNDRANFMFSSFVIAILLFASARSAVAEEPRTQALVPGMNIRRLPLELTNIDSVEYGPDGRLYAAAYDGRVHVLTDTDGDGIEDKSEVFWEKAGDLLTPVGILPTRDGVYVAARGKIALLKDTDGDGKADTSEAVVTGWPKETYNSELVTTRPDWRSTTKVTCTSVLAACPTTKRGSWTRTASRATTSPVNGEPF